MPKEKKQQTRHYIRILSKYHTRILYRSVWQQYVRTQFFFFLLSIIIIIIISMIDHIESNHPLSCRTVLFMSFSFVVAIHAKVCELVVSFSPFFSLGIFIVSCSIVQLITINIRTSLCIIKSVDGLWIGGRHSLKHEDLIIVELEFTNKWLDGSRHVCPWLGTVIDITLSVLIVVGKNRATWRLVDHFLPGSKFQPP